MRTFALALLLALAALTLAAPRSLTAGDAFDFGDMPPLPPPLVDDAPAPPPLTPSGSAPTAPPSMPPAAASATPPPPSGITPPLAPPPLAPPLAPPPSDVPAVSLPGAVPDPTAPLVPASAASASEAPRLAKISGGRVNVRAGPNTQYESIAVLTTGSPVTVLAKNNEWFKIVFPPDQLASIHKNFVDADIEGEIPEAGLPGIVNTDNAEVHAFYWDKSTVVGKLNKGDPVVIKQERGQWYRIAAPETARAYVFAEYVRLDGSGDVAADTAPAPENPAIDLAQSQPDATGRLKQSKDDERVIALKESYFKRIREHAVREEEMAQTQVNRLEQALNDLEAKIKEIDQETSSQYTWPTQTTAIGSAAWAPPDPLYGGYTGWIENIGRVGGNPASFRLTKGGEVRFYLRSDRFSLADYVGRRVWVNGNIELASGASANVLNVEQVRILTDFEIEQSMQQTASVPMPQAATQYVAPTATDPYSLYEPTPASPQPVLVPNTAPIPAPSDPSMLPDVVGMGQGSVYDAAGPGIIVSGSMGEIESDYYENPIISEIGP